jgi:protein O-mannose beta-1,4-N-acetylglucosaminyltransferase
VKNLCFEADQSEFVFLHSAMSAYDGVPRRPFAFPFVDMTAIYDHNTQHLAYTDVSSASIVDRQDVYMVAGSSLLFRRFNPNNIMHALHDDLIPLFVTMRHMGGGSFDSVIDRDIQLVYFEGWDAGSHLHLMKLLSNKVFDCLFTISYCGLCHSIQAPLSSSSFPRGLTCFEQASIGMSKESLWWACDNFYVS